MPNLIHQKPIHINSTGPPYVGSYQILMMKLFCEKINGYKPLMIFHTNASLYYMVSSISQQLAVKLLQHLYKWENSQRIFNCSKSTIEILGKGVKYVQS